jgi:hypothetical protein
LPRLAEKLGWLAVDGCGDVNLLTHAFFLPQSVPAELLGWLPDYFEWVPFWL